MLFFGLACFQRLVDLCIQLIRLYWTCGFHLVLFCMCHFLDLSTYFLVQAKDEIWNLMRRPLGRVPPFQCSIVSHASLQLKWMLLNSCCGETYRQFPYRYYLTDSSYLLERCKMMRTCVWAVYFPDPWLHFGGMCRKLNPLEQSERFPWCKCLSSHSRHQPCSSLLCHACGECHQRWRSLWKWSST